MHWLLERPEPPTRAARWAVLGVFLLFAAAGAARTVGEHPVLAASGLAVAVAAGAAATFGPARSAVAAVVVGGTSVILLGDGMSSNLAFFGLAALASWCALSEPVWVTGAFWVAAVAVFAAEWAFVEADPGWGAWMGGTTFAAVASLLGRRQRDLLLELRAAQAGLAQRAQDAERTRIARELHDVIGHSLTVSLMHVSAARLALDEDRDEAARALAEAERLGRASLDEVRHAVGLLRTADGAARTSPLPGGAEISALVERFRAAGADVRTTEDGDLTALPQTVGLAAYRILQEALTNAVKHAPGAPAVVHTQVQADALRLSVDSAGPPRRGSGLGLVGMRERAESLGGTCVAGPGGSGWLVQAELPLSDRP